MTSLGDTTADTAFGQPSTVAGLLAGAGSYSITQGSVVSPAGYNLTIVPGSLEVLSRPTQPDLFTVPHDSPAGSISLPQICTAVASASVAYSDGNGGDAVDREWSKVKQRMVVTSCTGVRMKDACGDF
jgi:hypothetical protein